MKYKLSDDVLAAMAQSVQLAMLTGTDVVDHLRLLEVEPASSGDELVLTADAVDRIKRNVDDMLVRSLQIKEEMEA